MYTYNMRGQHIGEIHVCYRHAFVKAMDDLVKPTEWFREHALMIDRCTRVFGPPSSRDSEGRWCHTPIGIGVRDERDVVAFKITLS